MIFEPLLNAVEQGNAIGLREVDGHIAAENYVKFADGGEVFHQVQTPESDQGAQFIPNLPTLRVGDKEAGAD